MIIDFMLILIILKSHILDRLRESWLYHPTKVNTELNLDELLLFIFAANKYNFR